MAIKIWTKILNYYRSNIKEKLFISFLSKLIISLSFAGIIMISIYLYIQKCNYSVDTDLLITSATVSYVIVTFLYMLFTYDMVKEMKNAREEEKRPLVTFEIIHDEKNHSILHGIIKNYGNSPAFNINIEFNPKVPYYPLVNDNSKYFSDINLFKNLSFLAPNREIVFFYDVFIDYEKNNKIMEFDVTIKYTNSLKRKFIDKYHMDLNIFTNLCSLSNPNNTGKQIEKIQQSIGNIERQIKQGIKIKREY